MGGTHANPAIGLKRPSGNLLSGANVFNILTHIFLAALIQGTLWKKITEMSDYDSHALELGEQSEYFAESCLGDPLTQVTTVLTESVAAAVGTVISAAAPAGFYNAATHMFNPGTWVLGTLTDVEDPTASYTGCFSDGCTLNANQTAVTDAVGNSFVISLVEQPTAYPSACFAPVVMYYIASLEYILVAIPFALGMPWKRLFLTNWEFTGWLAVSLASTLCLLLVHDQPGFFREDDMPLPTEWRTTILYYGIIYLVAVLAFDIVVSPWVVARAKRLWRSREKVGPAFQRTKVVDGQRAKEWSDTHTDTALQLLSSCIAFSHILERVSFSFSPRRWLLRGQFESQWSSETNDFVDNYRTPDGSKRAQ